jgi:hypothetical protein
VDSGLTLDNPYEIESISLADPLVITITGHPFVDGDEVDITDIIWYAVPDSKGVLTRPQYLNKFRYVVDNATANTFEIILEGETDPVDGSDFEAYISGGKVRKAVDNIAGLKHLANTDVVVLADGNVIKGLTVSATGVLQLDRNYSRIHIGLSYVSDLETLDLELQDKVITGSEVKVSEVAVRFEKSRGLLIGPNEANLTEMKQREFEKMGEPTNLLTGVKKITLPPDWKSNGRIFIRQVDPLPMNILGVTLDFDTE